jgi:hypothetical protein
MKNRKQKKQDEKKRQESLRLERKERLKNALSAEGLLEGCQNLPRSVLEAAVSTLPARPVVRIDPQSLARPDLDRLKEGLEAILDATGIKTDDGRLLPAADVLSVCPILPGGFAGLTTMHLAEKQRLFVKEAAGRALAFLREKGVAVLECLRWTAMFGLLRYTRIDEQVLGCVMEDLPRFPGKPLLQLTLSHSEPRVERVVIDDVERRAYWCGLPWWLEGVRWLECDGAALGLQEGRKYPIFIQSHAIHKLRERLPEDLLTERDVKMGLLESFTDLRLERQGEDTYRIEYHLTGHRVGYLTARVAQGKLVVTTFLFLTMSGTPEGTQLRERLRLTRWDIEHEGLDRLGTFLGTDVHSDPGLAAALEKCGCGSLLALARSGFAPEQVPGRAAELKRFLGIAEDHHPTGVSHACCPGRMVDSRWSWSSPAPLVWGRPGRSP